MKKKNIFLTWVAACGFGAGQMYLGYMKRGLSMMLIAVADCFMVGFFNNEVFLLFLPVIWACAFFDTFNLRNQDAPKPDAMLFDISWFMGQNWKHLLESKHGLFGWVLIGIGAYALYNNFVAPTLWEIARSFGVVWLSNFLYGMPTLVVAALLVGAGIYLLKTPQQDDYVSFGENSSAAAVPREAPAQPNPPAPVPTQGIVDIDRIFAGAQDEQSDAVKQALQEEFGAEGQQSDKNETAGISSLS